MDSDNKFIITIQHLAKNKKIKGVLFMNSTFQQIHTTTNTMTMFSGDTMLKIALYDQSISLAFINAVTGVDGKRTFPKENAIKMVVTADRVAALFEIMKNRTMLALEDNISRSDSILCNKDGSNMLCVEVSPEMLISLIAYTGIDENRIPKNTVKFQFQDTIALKNYNPENGEFEADDKPIRSQCILFMKALEHFISAHSGAETHFSSFYNRYHDKRFINSIDGIATKLGAATVSGPSVNNPFNNNIPGASVQSGGSFNPNMSQDAQVECESVDSLNAMFM